jgi:hypothetical protein
MSSYSHDKPVEQILFGWTAKGGLGPTRHSIGLTDHEVDRWADRLSKYSRLSPTYIDHRAWVPPRAFSYFEFADRTAALLARFDNGESGRNNSHALVGPAATLGRHAFVLSNWNGWVAEDPISALPSVDQRDWPHCASRWQDTARLEMQAKRPGLVVLVREVLLGDATHFTVRVGTEDDPLPLLTLVRDVLDPVLSLPVAEFEWTFSTYEESDTLHEASAQEDGAPRFWFVRSLPTSGLTDRRRVRIDETAEDDPHGALAADLVTNYLRQPEEYRAIIRDKLTGAVDPARRVARLLEDFERQPRHRSVPERSVFVAETVPATVSTSSGGTSSVSASPRTEGFAAQSAVSTSDGQVGRRYGDGGNTANSGSRGRVALPSDVDELLTKLYNGRGLMQEDVRRHVAELRKLWESEKPYEIKVQRMVGRVDKRLVLHDRILLVVTAGLVLVAFLVFATAQREVSVPTPPTVTVTYIPTPLPAPQTETSTSVPRRPTSG